MTTVFQTIAISSLTLFYFIETLYVHQNEPIDERIILGGQYVRKTSR